MPEISRFYGIVIKMYFADHNPPHFHAEYGEHRAVFGIDTLALLSGRLPPRAMGLVTEWAAAHQADLRGAWDRARSHEPPGTIDPLP